MRQFKALMFSGCLLLIANCAFGQASSNWEFLKSSWESGDWYAARIASEQIQASNPNDSLARFVFEASAILGRIPNLEGNWQVPDLPSDAPAQWSVERLFVIGLHAHMVGDLLSAERSFAEYLQMTSVEDRWHEEATLRLAQCKSHVDKLTGWTPLVSINQRESKEVSSWELFDVPDSVGRWINVPGELRSRYDRKRGFIGTMFVHPFQQRAYFASDLDGSGDTDICEVSVLENGTFGTISKLPFPINTDANERTPFYDTQSNKLYWSANRPDAWGGYDIYFVTLNSLPARVNSLPFAINSTSDESHYTPLADGWTAWFCTNRSQGVPEAIHHLADSPKNHPVEMELAWDFVEDFKPDMQLSIWNLDADQLLWGEALKNAKGSTTLNARDGMRLRARITQSGSTNYAVTEWVLPSSADARKMRFEWNQLKEQPVLVKNESAEIVLSAVPETWNLSRPAEALPDPPSSPINEDDMPERWRELMLTNHWVTSTWEEHWIIASGLESVELNLVAPNAPQGLGWEDIEIAKSWNETSLKPFTRRLMLLSRAHKAACSQEVHEGWESACEALGNAIQIDRNTIEQGLVWNRLARSVEAFDNLRNNMPVEMRTSMQQVKWYAEAEELMKSGLKDAIDQVSWFPLLGTEEVWRDWLWIAWNAYMERMPEEHENAVLQSTWWELEQSFAQPSWHNLEAASRALANLILGSAEEELVEAKELDELAESLIEVPGSQDRNPTTLPTLERASVEQPKASSSAPVTSNYIVQLGAFRSEPDGWPFYGVAGNLVANESQDWIRVGYNGFETKEAAIEFMQSLQAHGAYADAFIVEVSVESEWKPRTFDRIAGIGITGRINSQDEVNKLFKSRGGRDIRVWPNGDGTYEAMLGPFWSKDHTTRVANSIQHFFQDLYIQTFPNGERQKFEAKDVVHASSASNNGSSIGVQEKEESMGGDKSLWRIKIASFPGGADVTARAAFNNIPAALGPSIVPHRSGTGEDYMTSIITGEPAAIAAMEQLKSIGFSNARLIPIH